MLAIKSTAALLLIGVGGLLGLQHDPARDVAAPVVTAATTTATTAPTPAAPGLPATDTLRAALDAALEARIRTDLDDAGAKLAIGPLALERVDGRSVQARGQALVQVPGSRSIPVEVVGTYDLIDGRLAEADYTAHPVESDLTPVDRAVRAALGRRIGERIAAEFPDQRTRFELLEISGVGYGPHRTRLLGVGLTDFGDEGVAWTPFEAIIDRHTGAVVELRYDLRQDRADALVGL